MTKEQKEKAKKIWDDVKIGLEKGYAASKKGLKKAGAALQAFGDKSVVTLEKKQFESKRKKVYALIGEVAAQKLSAKKSQPLSASDIADLLKEVDFLKREISKREKILKEFEKSENQNSKSEKNSGAKTSARAAKKSAPKTAAKAKAEK